MIKVYEISPPLRGFVDLIKNNDIQLELRQLLELRYLKEFVKFPQDRDQISAKLDVIDDLFKDIQVIINQGE